MAETKPDGASEWQRWKTELELSGKTKGYEDWIKKSEAIVKRYRDDRGARDSGAADGTTPDSDTRFNILWSNIQTLGPALYAKPPKPVVERRYLDRDDVARTASMILERALLYDIEEGSFHASLKKAVQDRLLPGRGTVWVRYEPTFRRMPIQIQGDPEDEADGDSKTAKQSTDDTTTDGPDDDKTEAPKGDAAEKEPDEQVAYECTVVDYVYWKDFRTSAGRSWEQVWWVAKRVFLTRDELRKRFKGKTKDGKLIADVITLDWKYDEAGDDAQMPDDSVEDYKEKFYRAEVWEIWDKRARRAEWWNKSYSDGLLDEVEDPLGLKDFFPCPKPLYATTTNDSLIPVPDYYEYQDQAVELDDLTTRISSLTKAIKIAGVYDASIPDLARMFEEGFENKLVPCDNMTEFMQKAGPSGMGHVWLLPLKDMVAALGELYIAREQVKQTLYEITGVSDIVRGQQSTGPAETATAQRIKGQFASMRLNDMQADVIRFARDTLRIMGEIIAEHYAPMTLFLVSAYEEYAREQWPPMPPEAIPPQPPQMGMMGHNGGPPMPGMLGQAPSPMSSSPSPMAAPTFPPAGGGGVPAGLLPPGGAQPIMLPPPLDPAAIARKKAADMFQAALALIRDDKLRGFRIDIESDSMVEPDQQAMQEASVKFLQVVGQFLAQAVPMAQENPKFMPMLGQMLLFLVRKFRVGRSLESVIEQMVDDMAKQVQNPAPKPPSPEEIKAQTAQAQSQADLATQKMEMQATQQELTLKAQVDQQHAQGQIQVEQGRLAIEQQRMQMERERLAMELQQARELHAMKLAEISASAHIDGRRMAMESQASEREHQLGLETMDAKAEAAKRSTQEKSP